MFTGEEASLRAIHSTHTVKCPAPIQTLNQPEKGAAIIMEYIHLTWSRDDAELGEAMARYGPSVFEQRVEKLSQTLVIFYLE